MSKICKNTPDKDLKSIGDHKKYLSRITKTLYYGKLPKAESLSLPVTELAAELFSEAQKGKSLQRLHCYDAARISRNACVSPCYLVLAILYLERLKKHNPEYVNRTAPSDLFLVSLMVSCKFLFDDGEEDEVYIKEWAASGGISVKELVHLEKEFLKAIDWEIYVNELSFWKKLGEMESTLAVRQGVSRGHFTYTELQNLFGMIEIQNLIHCIAVISFILAATYTAGLLTLVSSVYFVSQVPGTSLYTKRFDNEAITYPLTTNNRELTAELDTVDETKTDSKCTRNINVVNYFKTSILLATIKTSLCNQTNKIGTEINDVENNVQYISWDYWNIPLMDWLAKSSQLVTSYTLELPIKYYPYFLETSASNSKCIELEAQIHKATKTRIQDQIESSWHKEWTDTFRCSLFF